MKDRKKQKRLTRSEFSNLFTTILDLHPIMQNIEHTDCVHFLQCERHASATDAACQTFTARRWKWAKSSCYVNSNMSISQYFSLSVCVCVCYTVLAPANVTINKSLNLPTNRFNQFRTNRSVSLPFLSVFRFIRLTSWLALGICQGTEFIPLQMFH